MKNTTDKTVDRATVKRKALSSSAVKKTKKTKEEDRGEISKDKTEHNKENNRHKSE